MSYDKDHRVDAYLDGLAPWQGRLAAELRDLIHGVDPGIEETIKRTVQPYFVLQGNICAFLGTKDHLNLFLYDPIAPDPHGIVTSGHGNATGRTVSFWEGDPIPRQPLTDLLAAIVANNKAGGWRKLQAAT